MHRSCSRTSAIILPVVFLAIAAGPGYGGPAKRRAEVPEGAVVMGRGEEIFANSEAAETVREARRYDPMTAERDMKDRNKAIIALRDPSRSSITLHQIIMLFWPMIRK
jgi:hypothetical protein